MKGVLVATLFVLALGAPAAAQPRVAIGANAGVSVPVADELNDATDADLSWTGALTTEIGRGLAVRGEVGRHELNTPFQSFDFCDALGIRCEGEVRFTNFSAGIQYGGGIGSGAFGLNSRRIMPYGFFLVGAYHVDQVVLDQSASSFTVTANAPQPALLNVSETKPGFAAGGGLNVRLSDHLLLQADVHLHWVDLDGTSLGERTPPLGWSSFVSPTIGLWVGVLGTRWTGPVLTNRDGLARRSRSRLLPCVSLERTSRATAALPRRSDVVQRAAGRE